MVSANLSRRFILWHQAFPLIFARLLAIFLIYPRQLVVSIYSVGGCVDDTSIILYSFDVATFTCVWRFIARIARQ